MKNSHTPNGPAMVEYSARFIKTQLHSTRAENASLRRALSEAMESHLRRGGTEGGFAQQCGLTPKQLHELLAPF